MADASLSRTAHDSGAAARRGNALHATSSGSEHPRGACFRAEQARNNPRRSRDCRNRIPRRCTLAPRNGNTDRADTSSAAHAAPKPLPERLDSVGITRHKGLAKRPSPALRIEGPGVGRQSNDPGLRLIRFFQPSITEAANLITTRAHAGIAPPPVAVTRTKNRRTKLEGRNRPRARPSRAAQRFTKRSSSPESRGF